MKGTATKSAKSVKLQKKGSKDTKSVAVKGRPPKIKQDEFIALYYGGWSYKDMAKYFGVTKGALTQTKDKLGLINREEFDLAVYDQVLPNIMKNKVFEAMQHMTSEKFEKAGVAQLSTFLGTLIDKIRLMEGKSTENVAAAHVHALDKETRQLLQQAIQNRTQLKITASQKEAETQEAEYDELE